jgi:hypothetical protein
VHPDELADRPETLRLCGKLRLKKGPTEIAEADFREAIRATSVGAKTWELRATTSLALPLANNDSFYKSSILATLLTERFNNGR